jgi:hypothetical protein
LAEFLVEFLPAPEPRDGRSLTEQEFIGSLEQQGLEARPARWPSVGSYIGGRGGGFEQIANIFIGAAAGGFAIGVTKSFADALGKDLYGQFKRFLHRIVKGREDQVRRARLEATFELPGGQWLFFWLNAKDLYKNLDKLGTMKLQIDDEEPRVWFFSLEKRRFLFFERSRWTVTPYPFRDQQPPPLPK